MQKEGKLGNNGPLRHSEGYPHSGEVLRRSEGLLRWGEDKGIAQVRQGIALLRRGEMLHHGEDTIYRGKNFQIFVPKVSYSCFLDHNK